MPTGRIKKLVEDRGFGFIVSDEYERGKRDLFFHFSDLTGVQFEELSEGDDVDFEIETGKKGLKAGKIKRTHGGAASSGTTSTSSETPPSREAQGLQAAPGQSTADEHLFLNPYNFVRLLDGPTAADPSDDERTKIAKTLLGKCAPPPHDRYVGLSGRITCRLTSRSPLFVSDAHGVTEAANGHKTYRFFRYNDEFAIPASSLRGMIRSVLEAVTNSCMIHVADKQLDFRLAATRTKRLKGARVIECPNQRERRDGKVELMDVAWIDRSVIEQAAPQLSGTSEDPGLLDPLLKKHSWPNESPYEDYFDFVTNDRLVPVKARLIQNSKHSDASKGRIFWEVAEILEVADADTSLDDLDDEREKDLVWGYLKITGPTVVVERDDAKQIRKHRERFFYRTDIDSDDSASGKFAVVPHEAEYEGRENVSTRYAKVRKAQFKNQQLPYVTYLPSETLQPGNLVWVQVSKSKGDMIVDQIGSVSIPKLRYQKGLLNWIPDFVQPCRCLSALCPACRVFGWVSADAADVADVAYKGRVRFSFGKLKTKTTPLPPTTLAILGTPKPTCVPFYMRNAKRTAAWDMRDIDDGYDSAKDAATLAGRKFYRRPKMSDLERTYPDPKNQGVDRHEYEHIAGAQSDQNRTVADALPAGSVFEFSIDYENLTLIELGALLWSLELEADWAHRIGYAKPLGFGDIGVEVQEADVIEPKSRYTSISADPQPLTKKQRNTLVSQFKHAIATVYRADDFNQMLHVKDLASLLGTPSESEPPVHYPRTSSTPHPDGKNFEWFTQNRRGKRGTKRDKYVGRNLGLTEPSDTSGLPLSPTRKKPPHQR